MKKFFPEGGRLNSYVTQIFPVNVTGIVSARDHMVVDFDKKSLLRRIREFADPKLTDDEIRERFFKGKGSSKYPAGDSRGWKLPEARKRVQSDFDWDTRVSDIQYRPFDIRKIYYVSWMVDWPRSEIMKNMLGHSNFAMLWTRPMSPNYSFSVSLTNLPSDQCAVGNKSAGAGITYEGPLYLYPDTKPKDTLFDLDEPSEAPGGRKPNLAPEFVADFSARLGMTFIPDGKGNLGLQRGTGILPVKEALPHGLEAHATGEKCGTGILPVKETATHGQDAHGTTETHGLEAHGTGDAGTIQKRRGAYLPHWTRDAAIYAVTFRLWDALPTAVVEGWRWERQDILNRAAAQHREVTVDEHQRLEQLYSEKVEAFLDAGHGACYLQDAAIAKLVADALHYFDGTRYHLHAWCIMANHVHVVVEPCADYTLAAILHSWKSFTANAANAALGRQGECWQTESYDHLIRDEADYAHAIAYVLDNPSRVGLEHWPWVYNSGTGFLPEKETSSHGLEAHGTRGTGILPVMEASPHGLEAHATTGTFGPEDVFDYMYAVFHAPTYRRRYAEFLKIDFPRLPLTRNPALFRALCALGEALVGLHLLEQAPALITGFPVAGSNLVEKVQYSAPQGSDPGCVWINAKQYIAGVPPEVWAFHVGGYQVCEKWLKDRKGRVLSYDDLTHYQHVVAALAETIRLMAEIDAVIDAHGGWPLQ